MLDGKTPMVEGDALAVKVEQHATLEKARDDLQEVVAVGKFQVLEINHGRRSAGGVDFVLVSPHPVLPATGED